MSFDDRDLHVDIGMGTEGGAHLLVGRLLGVLGRIEVRGIGRHPPEGGGSSQVMTTSRRPPMSWAWRAAQRMAWRDGSEPSTPTTMRG